MAFNAIDNTRVNAAKHQDDWYAAEVVAGKEIPYASVAAACAAIPPAVRMKGRACIVTVGGLTVEHWWKDDLTDAGLILKTVDISGKADKTSLNTEVINRTNADLILNDKIGAEVTRALLAESIIGNRINTNSSDILKSVVYGLNLKGVASQNYVQSTSLIGMLPKGVYKGKFYTVGASTVTPTDNPPLVAFNTTNGRITFDQALDADEDVWVLYSQLGDSSIIPNSVVLHSEFDPLKSYIDDYVKLVLYTLNNSGYSWGVLDDNLKMPIFLDEAGEFGTYAYPKINATIKEIIDYNNYVKARLIDFTSGTGYSWGVLDDNNKIPLGVSDEGNVMIWGTDIMSLIGTGLSQYVKYIEPSKNITGTGDSLTENGRYLVRLQQLLGSDRTYTNTGIGGDTSTQIAFRQGGLSVAVAITGNLIPASGSVVITPDNVNIMQVSKSTTGFLKNIKGVFARAANGVYSFTRSASGSAIVTNRKEMFNPDGLNKDFEIQIIWAGRNDYLDPNAVLANVDRMVAYLKPTNKKFIVASVLNGNFAGEFIGQTNYNTLVGLNNSLRLKYPRNYVELREVLVRSYNPSLSQDVIDFNNDIPPLSLRSDNIHLNNTGQDIVAQEFYNFITFNNW